MNDPRLTTPTETSPRRGDGFTLTEVLIVVTMMGLLAATLAAVFTVIVRTTPDAQERVTDARSLKGLVTWVPQDMDATPPGGFRDAPTVWPCSGAAPADSYNIIAMSWNENGDTTIEFDASYRYELKGEEWVIARYSCQDSGAATRNNMTSALPPWSSLSPPAWVEMCSTVVDQATGDCPAGSHVTDSTTQPVESMKMTLTLLDGTPYTIDAAAKNPDEDLADDPNAVTNYPPVAGVSTYSMTMIAGETATIDLSAVYAISDPEGNFLTSAVDSWEPMPAGITATSSDPLLLTVHADASLATGVLGAPVSLIVSDSYGGSVEMTLVIEIVPPPNDPPTAVTITYTVAIEQGETMVLPLDQTHGVSDPNGDALTIDVTAWPAALTQKPDVGSPLGELQMSINAHPGAALGLAPDPIKTTIYDASGAYVEVDTYVEVIAAVGNTAPTVVSADAPASMEAGNSVALSVDASHGAADPDGDVIWVELDPAGTVPAGLTVTTAGLVVTIAADASMSTGVAGPVPLLVHDWRGASTPITVTVEILVPPPPPPSPCVLGNLALSQNPVGRYGTGEGPKELGQDVLVSLTYSGTCDGLVLKYDTGHPSGLGSGVGRVFPTGSPSTILLRGYSSGGTERWTKDDHVLTASTTSAVSPSEVSITLTVN